MLLLCSCILQGAFPGVPLRRSRAFRAKVAGTWGAGVLLFWRRCGKWVKTCAPKRYPTRSHGAGPALEIPPAPETSGTCANSVRHLRQNRAIPVPGALMTGSAYQNDQRGHFKLPCGRIQNDEISIKQLIQKRIRDKKSSFNCSTKLVRFYEIYKYIYPKVALF